MVRTRSKIAEETAKVQTVEGHNKPLAHGIGRRKCAVARVWLKRGSGSFVVNGRPATQYFDVESARLEAHTPFNAFPIASYYDIAVNVVGGGICAQAGAVKLGIARALVSVDDQLRSVLRQHGLLTVDSRKKERKKYGQKAARRKFQFVKR